MMTFGNTCKCESHTLCTLYSHHVFFVFTINFATLLCTFYHAFYLYSLVKMHCGVLFYWFSYFSFVCSFSPLTLLAGSFDP